MMRRYALRDDQWERIKGWLPGREGHVGVTAKDNRLFVEAVLYRYRAGLPAVFEQLLYKPFVQAVLWTSEQMRRLQAGSLHLYLAYLLATLVALLLWAR